MKDEEELPQLTFEQQRFIELLMWDESVKGNASEAYRRVYPDKKDWKDNSIWTAASLLRSNKKVKQWIEHLTATKLDRMICSKEDHLAQLASLRNDAWKAGHYAAAINAELSRGRVAGHHIERKEITHKKGTDLDKLVELSKSNNDLAFTYAKELGLESDLKERLETIH